jgi:plasmid maintenance system antidote protein VapI
MTHEFKPDWVIAPSETLAEWMHENGMSVRALAAGARAFGPKSVTRERAEQLIGDVLDRKPLTADHAACLARGTGVSMEFWLNYEHNYRAGLAAGLTDTSGPCW